MLKLNKKNTIEIKGNYSPWILIVTVNDIETAHVIKCLDPLEGYDKILVSYVKNSTYYIGKLGVFNVIHVQSGMGSLQKDSVITTVDNSIRHWHPKVIIMIGVAWGKDEKNHQIGDVIISKKVISYETAKKTNGGTIPRGSEFECGTILLDRFKSTHNWRHQLAPNVFAKKVFGTVLSGEKLIDDREFKDELCQLFPEAIGGEMEGAGLSSIAAFHQVNEWILVKGICDWGYNKQNQNKEEHQRIAIESATSLCLEVLSDKAVLETIFKKNNKSKTVQKNDQRKERVNAYKLFYHRNNKGISIKNLTKLSGISENKLLKFEKLNYKEYEDSLRIFCECFLYDIKVLEKALGLQPEYLVAKKDDLLHEMYKSYYGKRKGARRLPLPSKNAKIVIFDFDGTIAAPNFSRTTWERIWVRMGYSIKDCEHFHKQYSNKRISHEEWCSITERHFKDKGLSKTDVREIAKEISLLDGFEDAIKYLKENNILLYIVSGSIREIIREVLGNYCKYFEEISANRFYFTDDEKLDKIIGTKYDFEGKADFILDIIDKTSIAPSEILFVGNSFNDTYAHLAGVRTLCINPFHTNYTNTTYWHNYIKEVNNLKDIFPQVFIEKQNLKK